MSTFRTMQYGKHPLRYIGAQIWNQLDDCIKQPINQKVFIWRINK